MQCADEDGFLFVQSLRRTTNVITIGNDPRNDLNLLQTNAHINIFKTFEKQVTIIIVLLDGFLWYVTVAMSI